MKLCTSVRLKPFNDRCKFELDRASSKNNIAEKEIALGHGTDNKFATASDLIVNFIVNLI